MQQLLRAAALLTFCSLLVSGCETTRVAVAVKPDADRIDCVNVTGRPALPPEYVIDWSRVTTVAQARSEHDAFVRVIRTREGIVAGHLVVIENQLFACSNDAAWLRDLYSKLPSE